MYDSKRRIHVLASAQYTVLGVPVHPQCHNVRMLSSQAGTLESDWERNCNLTRVRGFHAGLRIKGSTAIAAVFSVLEIMLRHAGPHMLLLLKGVYRVDRWTDELVLRMVAITWLRFRYSSYRSDIAIGSTTCCQSTTRAVTRSAKLLKVCSSVACLSPVKTEQRLFRREIARMRCPRTGHACTQRYIRAESIMEEKFVVVPASKP